MTVVVAGGTGNIGSHIVRTLLSSGARVVVPSRSPEKLRSLTAFLTPSLSASALAQMTGIVGDLGDEGDARRCAEDIVSQVGTPTAVVASLGRFTPAPSLLESDHAALQQVLNDYVVAHFNAARAFIPLMQSQAGKYIFINGPLAFQPWKHFASGLVSIATAAQHMLFRTLAQELEGESLSLIELVNYAFVRDRRTEPGSAVSGGDVGTYVVDLLGSETAGGHGESIHLSAPLPAHRK